MKKQIRLTVLILLTALLLLAQTTVTATAAPERMLTPGGMAFGIKFYAKGALVVSLTDIETAAGVCCPAREGGLAEGDVITKIDDLPVNSAETLQKAVNSSNGSALNLEYKRNNIPYSVVLTPVTEVSSNTLKLGIWVRDSTAGIGTVTFIDRETGDFGGLGHSISDPKTGTLMPLDRGTVVDVEITGVIKGQSDKPGELTGVFGTQKRGELYKNTESGVFGEFNELPENLRSPIPVGRKSELKAGKASILTTINGNTAVEYEIMIEKILSETAESKNFLILVTDKTLLEKAGGIVQGMSGSPVIQNGKLVGAVTHVLVSDPTRGYGIFIDNMLSAE